MGLIFAASRWLDCLWSEHLEMSSPARDFVEAGIRKQGEPFAGFPSDLHARLYLPADPRQLDGPAWATRLHALASELGEWQRLKGMCSRNGFAAGVATEAMLAQLLSLVPERPNKEEVGPHLEPGDEARLAVLGVSALGDLGGVPLVADLVEDRPLRQTWREASLTTLPDERQLIRSDRPP